MTGEPPRPSSPPEAERRPHPLTAHGDTRVDDWYWVRHREDPQVRALLEAENAHTAAATSHLEPLVEEIYQEILAHTALTEVTYPAPKGAFAYYRRTIEGEQHSVLCRRPAEAGAPRPSRELPGDGEETVLLNENELAEGLDYFEVGETALSPDQRLLAYSVDTTGAELLSVRVREIESGKEHGDVIEGAYYGLCFSGDGASLFYTRPDETHRPYQVWRHVLGTPQVEDALVFEEPDERFFVNVDTSKDDELVLISTSSSDTSEWHYLPAGSPKEAPRLVARRREGVLYELEHHLGELLILSNAEEENFALYRASLEAPEKWETLIPGRSDVRLENLDVVAGHVVAYERGHAATALRVVSLRGGDDRLVEAPEAGTILHAANLEFETDRYRYEASTLVQPRQLFELDLTSGTTTLLRTEPVPGFDPTEYRTERAFATSADGTQVPLTLAWRKDRPEGPGPALLYGYGAYGASSDPVFATARPVYPLLDRGVLYAIAHVRGGEELGRRWYLDGRLENKHHSFEDFVAAAHFLAESGRTTGTQLAAAGASAGGLLMGGSVNLDPDAFAAVVAEVPFVDVLTTMLDPSIPLTTNEWEEWGDPLSSETAYAAIKAYSPYDNVAERPYPRMLVTAGLTDPRVGYFEPVKWVQKLRAAHPSNRERVLLQVELSAGHFGPSGRYHAWRKRAFVLAFILDALGVAADIPRE